MTQRLKISMTDEMYDAVEQLANERGQAMAYVIRESVAAYLERSKIRVQNVHPGWGGRRDTEDTSNA